MLLLPEYSLSTLDTIHHMDALSLLRGLASNSVDMVLCDPPYATTAIEWDKPLEWGAIWQELKRVTKRGAACVFTASQPFTTDLINSNRAWFRYEWIWGKSLATGYLNANRNPMKAHENIIVFAAVNPPYYPVMDHGAPYLNKRNARNDYVGYGEVVRSDTINAGERYPRSVLYFNSVSSPIHPTQKPFDLFEYLIKTYTCTGDVVLDFCMGSGTTAVAARNTGRHFIGCDTSRAYVDMARRRLIETDPFKDTPLRDRRGNDLGIKQQSLFREMELALGE